MKNIRLFVLFFQLFLSSFAVCQESAKELLNKAEQHSVNNKDSAILLANRASKLAKAEDDTTVYYESNLLKVYVLKNIGSINEAMQLTNTLLDKARTNENAFYEAKCLKTMGEISRQNANLEASLSYLFEALKKYRKIESKAGMADTYNRLAATYFQLSNYKKARQYADSSIRDSKAIADSTLLGNNYEILGAIARDQKTGKALQYFRKAEKMYRKYSPNDLPNVLFNIMLYYSRKGKYTKSIEVGEKAMKLARRLGNKDQLESISKEISDTYKARGDYKEALNYLQIHVDSKVELNRQTKHNLSVFYRQRFEARKQKHRIEMQEKRIQQEKTRQKYYLIGIAALVLFLLGGAYAYVKIKRKNKQMQAQKEKIEEQQAKIIKQNEDLQATNQKLVKLDKLKQDLTNMLVHDLKNPLNIVVNLAENRYVKSAGNVMNNLVMNMLDVNKFQEVTLTPEWTVCNLKRIVTNAEEQVYILIQNKELTLENNIPEDIYVNADEKLITRVFVNFLTNAIKHSDENKPVILDIGEYSQKQGSDFIEIAVIDYGPGISEENKNKIFERYFGDTSKSEQLSPTGLGLAFCKMAVTAHNGTVGVESEKGKYSRFYFTLPLA